MIAVGGGERGEGETDWEKVTGSWRLSYFGPEQAGRGGGRKL